MVDKTIQSGEKLQLNFDVENRGTRRGSQTVELLLDDTVVDEEAVVLDSTETGQLVLETDAFSDDDGGQVFVVETVIGTRTEATFEVEVAAIPDGSLESLLSQVAFHAQDLNDGDPVEIGEDQSGNGNDLNQSDTAPTYSTNEVNGYDAAYFDDDTLYRADADFTDVSQAFTVITVHRLDDTSTNRVVAGSDGQNQTQMYWGGNSEAWSMFAGNTAVEGSGDTTIQMTAVVFDGSNSELYEETTQTATGDAGTNGLTGPLLGNRNEGDEPWIGPIVYAEWHDGLPSSGLQDRLQEVFDFYLA